MDIAHTDQDGASFAALAARGQGVHAQLAPTPTPGAAPAPELSFVAQYWRIIRRRKWLIIGSVITGIALGLLLNVLTQRQYTATSTVEIAREDAQVLDVEGVRSEVTTADQEFYQTQYGLLRSRSLAERVARSMRLPRDAAFRSAFGLDGSDDAVLPTQPRGARAASAAELTVIRDILLDNITIADRRSSRLVDVSFTSPDPDLSARIADAWARGFIEANIARGFEDTQFVRSYLERELETMRRRLEESERAAVTYASEQGILAVQTTDSDGERTTSSSITEQNLVAFNTQLAEATADRVAAEAAFRSGSRGEVADTNALAPLRQRRAEVAAEYQRMLVQFEPEYPAARALREQVAQLDRSIAQEEARGAGSVGRDLAAIYRAAQQREAALRDQVSRATAALIGERRSGIQYSIFQREADNNRQLYDALLQRYKQVGVAAGATRTNVALVDRADIPARPSAPNLFVNLLLGGFLGALAGLLFTIIREQIDVAINDPAELERVIGLPLLGTVPDFGDDEDALVPMLRDPKSALSDSMLSLRTRISFTTTHGFPRTLAVTSSRPAEGKSTTSIAIANALAAAGKRVLLIDCDMRSPSMNEMLGVSNDFGLSNALAGEDNFGTLIQRIDGFNFAVMAAGPNPPNAAELLSADRLQLLFETLAGQFDHFICDSPPVIGLADALLLSTNVEATLYVVRAHGTRVNEVRSALQRLRGVPSHIIGVALTHFDAGQSAYGYDYGYGYGYGPDQGGNGDAGTTRRKGRRSPAKA